MSANSLVLYRQDGPVARLTLNRPQALNALSPALLEELEQRLAQAAEAAEVRAVILSGAGEAAFCAGADIRHLNRSAPLEVRAYAARAVAITRRIETLGKPVLALLHGHTLGGGLELAEACHLRLAAEDARLGHPEVRIGAVAGFGGTTRLPRLVGKGRAAELLLRGRVIDAAEALRIGLVQGVVPRDRLAAEGEAWIAELLALPAEALRLNWEALHHGLNLTLEESARLGADYFGLAAADPDFREGTAAFLEKRPPRFGARAA